MSWDEEKEALFKYARRGWSMAQHLMDALEAMARDYIEDLYGINKPSQKKVDEWVNDYLKQTKEM